jgi:hypothetical protein
MVSDATDWSSGASGMALEAEIAARLRVRPETSGRIA